MTLAKLNEVTRQYGVYVERERNRKYSVFTDGSVVDECDTLSDAIEAAGNFIDEIRRAWSRTDANA